MGRNGEESRRAGKSSEGTLKVHFPIFVFQRFRPFPMFASVTQEKWF